MGGDGTSSPRPAKSLSGRASAQNTLKTADGIYGGWLPPERSSTPFTAVWWPNQPDQVCRFHPDRLGFRHHRP